MANKFRTVYNSPYNTGFDANSFRRIAATDPQFALGEIIGSALSGAYANNYNNRGISKAVNKALESYGIGSNVSDDQVALQQVQQNMLQPGNDSIGIGAGDMEALNSVRQNYGLEAIQPKGPVISAGVVPQQDVQAISAQIAQMPGAGIVARENGARRIEEFNPDIALMNARQQMLKDGRTPYQIEMAMEQLKPQFAKMQDDAYRAQADRIMAELGQGDISDADYKQRIVELARLGDYGKNAANVYGKDIVTGRERWNAEQQAARENRQFNRQVALDDRRFAQQNAREDRRYAQMREQNERNNQYRLAIARERGYGRNGTGKNDTGIGGVSKEDATWADKTIKDLEEKLASIRMDNPQANLSQTDIQIYNQAAAIRSLANQQRAARYNLGENQQNAGNGKNESAGREFNPNDYNDQARALLGMIRHNNGVLDDKLAEDFREIIGLDRKNANPDEMTNRVIYDMRAYRKDANKNAGGKGGLF